MWTISKPLAKAAHLAGSGTAAINLATTQPNANLVVDVYDLDRNGTGPLITRQGFLARQAGARTLKLWSADWKLAKGHRIGVRVTDANGDWWIHQPSFQDVKVARGTITLPFLTNARTSQIAGGPGTQLAGYLGETITVPPETLAGAESAMNVPG